MAAGCGLAQREGGPVEKTRPARSIGTGPLPPPPWPTSPFRNNRTTRRWNGSRSSATSSTGLCREA